MPENTTRYGETYPKSDLFNKALLSFQLTNLVLSQSTYAYISIKYQVKQKSGNRSDLVHVAVSFELSLFALWYSVNPISEIRAYTCYLFSRWSTVGRQKIQEPRYFHILINSVLISSEILMDDMVQHHTMVLFLCGFHLLRLTGMPDFNL